MRASELGSLLDMTPTALLLALALATPQSPPTLVPQLTSSHLSAPQGLLLPAVSGVRGGQIFAGVRLTVAGSILTLLGAASAAGGVYGLINAGMQTGNPQTVSLVLGWTFTGFGMLLGAIGLPLLIVGIANLATAGHASLTLTSSGDVAVAF